MVLLLIKGFCCVEPVAWGWMFVFLEPQIVLVELAHSAKWIL
jgi:hypothetical protein